VGKACFRHRTDQEAGPSCPRCREPMTKVTRSVVSAKQHRAKFYFRYWYRCTNEQCTTSLVMPFDDPDAVVWHCKPFPLGKYFSGERRRAKRGRTRSNEAVITTPRRVGPGSDASEDSCPFDLPETSGDIALETLDKL
jgi:hypothetical protein